MRLTKHHGLGNDFLVVLAEANPELGPDPGIGPETARALCHRRRGIGADGLIVLARTSRAGIDGIMTLYNSDGSRAEMSGNGIRCLAHAICHHRGVDAAQLVIDTDAGRRQLDVSSGTRSGEVDVRVDLGEVTVGPRWTPSPAAAAFVGERRIATADIGNPHIVVDVDDPWAIDVATAGPLIEADFPEGINVHFIAPSPDRPDALDLTVWERGAGITEACGTGASAAATVANRWGIVGDRVEVTMPGGRVTVEVGTRSTVLVGPSVLIAAIEVDHG